MEKKEKSLLQVNISQIKTRIKSGEYRYTVHSLERSIERSISKKEIEEVILVGEIIEYYPEDKYGPSCLILGFTNENKPIHVQCSLEPVWIITCYDPSDRPSEWSEDFRKRR